MKFSFELPVRRDGIFILDKKDNIVAMIEYPDDDADYIVQAINSHEKFKTAIEKIADDDSYEPCTPITKQALKEVENQNEISK